MLMDCLARLHTGMKREAQLERRISKINLFEDHNYIYKAAWKADTPHDERIIPKVRSMAQRRDRDDPMIQIMLERRDQYRVARDSARDQRESGDPEIALRYDALAATHLKGMQDAESAIKLHSAKYHDRIQKMVAEISRIAAQVSIHKERMEVEKEDNPEAMSSAEVDAEMQRIRDESGS